MKNYKICIARKPIIVYKLVRSIDKNRCYLPYRNFIYFFNKEYTLKTLDKDFNPCIIVDGKIEKFMTLCPISRYFGSFTTLKALRYYLYINHIQLRRLNVAVCIIPKGALYSIDDICIFSDKIIIKYIL